MPAGIVDDYYLSLLVIDGDFKIGDVSDGNGSMNSQKLSQHDWDSNNSDVISINGFINSHTILQCNDWSNFKDMDGDVENGDGSSGYGYITIHTVYQQKGLKLLMNYNDRDDIEMNNNL